MSSEPGDVFPVSIVAFRASSAETCEEKGRDWLGETSTQGFSMSSPDVLLRELPGEEP